MADLNDQTVGAGAGAIKRRAHVFGFVQREGEGFFLINVFARFEGGGKALTVQVLRGGDDDSVDGRIRQQFVVTRVGGCVRHSETSVIEAAGINIGESGNFSRRRSQNFAGELHAAVARADDTDANPVIRAENASGGEASGKACSHVAYEVSARLHG